MKTYTPLILLCGFLMTAEGLNAGVMAPPSKAPQYVAPPPCGPWFSGIKGGWFWVQDTDMDIDNIAGVDPTVEVEFDTGWGITVIPLGYRLSDMLSISLSTGYYEADVDNVTFDDAILGSTTVDAGGELEVIPIMLNVVGHVPLFDRLSLYLGGGIGAVYTDLEASATMGGVTDTHSDDDWDFGLTGIAGLAYEIVDCVNVTVGYRYHHIFRDPDDVQGHSLEAGVVITW